MTSAFEEWTGDLVLDPAAFVDVDAVIVTPLRETQALFDTYPVLTRLYATLSAGEMTLDSVFDFNPDLPEVSNLRTATARWECEVGDPEKVDLNELILVVTLHDGREIRSRPFGDFEEPRPIPADVQAAAQRTFQRDTMTVGLYDPILPDVG